MPDMPDPGREDDVVMATIIGALHDEAFRKWRIATYGRLIDMDDGTTWQIQDDGTLVRVMSYWALGERSP